MSSQATEAHMLAANRIAAETFADHAAGAIETRRHDSGVLGDGALGGHGRNAGPGDADSGSMDGGA